MSEKIVLSRTAQKILYAMAVEGDKDLGAFSTKLWNVTKGMYMLLVMRVWLMEKNQ